MKVTRKLGEELSKLTAAPPDMDKEEMPANLYLSHLPNQIEGMPEKGSFEGRVKGKVRAHHTVTKDGKTHHNYDLDIHHFEAAEKQKSKPERKAKSVEKAFEEYGPGKNEK